MVCRRNNDRSWSDSGLKSLGVIEAGGTSCPGHRSRHRTVTALILRQAVQGIAEGPYFSLGCASS